MLSATIKGFMAAGTPLVGLYMTISTDELIRSDVTHDDFLARKYNLKIHHVY